MNLIEAIEKDSYVSTLDQRAQIALTFFEGLIHNFESDLDLAQKYKAVPLESGNFGAAFDGLGIKLDVERGESIYQPCTLTLSSSFAKIQIIANHPPGWLFVQISKRSALFEGLLHYGVIEVTLHPSGDRSYELNFTRCGWLWIDGMPDRDKIRPRLIVELLWKLLLAPEVPAQIEEANEKAKR